MNTVRACPDVAQLKRLASGELSPAESEVILNHLEACHTCATQVEHLTENSMLVDLIRRAALKPSDRPDSQALDRLLARLRKLSLPAQATQPAAPSPERILLRCPGCGKKLKVKTNLAGRKIKCPLCQATVPVPFAQPSPEADGTATSVTADTVHAEPVNPESASPQPTASYHQRLVEGIDLSELLGPPRSPGELGTLGTYRVLQVLGTGGMGLVFRAEDPQLQRPLALKAMRPNLAASESARKRFLREARAAAAIAHDNIVHIYQVGEDRGVPFMAMQLLEGESLEARLRRERRLPAAEVVRIGRETAEGLAAAHERGLIHRDIKPANLWLERPKQRVKILDFGVSRVADDEAQLTQLGAIVGTPAYMAPEQAGGNAIDRRCDLFSLGCVLYRMATGQMPFNGGNTFSILSALALQIPTPPCELHDGVPQPLSDLVMKLLARDPEERPESATAVANALRTIEDQSDTKPDRPRPETDADRSARKRPPWLRLAAAAGGVAASILAAIMLLWPTPRGVVRIESDDPNVEIVFDKSGLVVKGADTNAITLTAGQHGVHVKRGDFEFEADTFVLRRGETITLRVELLKDKIQVSADNRLLGTADLPPQAPTTVKRASVAVPAIVPQPLALKPGDAASAMALVRHPKPLPGLRSWDIETVSNRGDPVCCAFSPDGRLLATGGEDGSIRIWEPDKDRPVRVLLGHNRGQAYVTWSPDGKFLASCAKDSTLRLWSAATGQLLRTSAIPGTFGTAIAWSGDGRVIAVGSYEHGVFLWDVETDQLRKTLLVEPRTYPTSLAWSPDSKLLAEAWSSGKLVLTDAMTGRVRFEWTCPDKNPAEPPLLQAVFSPDGQWLAAAAWYCKNAYVWHVASGEAAARLQHTDWVTALGWTADAKQLITCSLDGIARFSDPSSGKLFHTAPANSAPEGVLSPGGRFLASSGHWSRLTVSDLELRSEWNVDATDSANAVAWSPTGDRLALAHCFGGTTIWDTKNGRLLRRLGDSKQGNAVIAWSPVGETLAVAGDKPAVVLWNAATGDRLATLDGHAGGCGAVAWSPDGRLLATGGVDKMIRIWQPGKQTPLRIFSAHTDQITALAWSPRGQTLASASADRTVRLWDAATGTPGQVLNPQQGINEPVTCLSWSPDARTLVSCRDGDPNLLWWEPATGKTSRTPVDYPVALPWSPDGTLLALGFRPGIRLLSANEHRFLRDLDPIPNPWRMRGLSWSPDGKTLLMADHTTSLQVLDVASGQQRGILVGLPEEGHLALSANGHWRGSPGIEKRLLYIAVTDAGQEILTPADFCRKYHWQNDPDQIRLLGN